MKISKLKIALPVALMLLSACNSMPKVPAEVNENRFNELDVKVPEKSDLIHFFICGDSPFDLVIDKKRVGNLRDATFEIHMPRSNYSSSQIELAGDNGPFARQSIPHDGGPKYLMVKTQSSEMDVGTTVLKSAVGIGLGLLTGHYTVGSRTSYKVKYETTYEESEFRDFCENKAGLINKKSMFHPETAKAVLRLGSQLSGPNTTTEPEVVSKPATIPLDQDDVSTLDNTALCKSLRQSASSEGGYFERLSRELNVRGLSTSSCFDRSEYGGTTEPEYSKTPDKKIIKLGDTAPVTNNPAKTHNVDSISADPLAIEKKACSDLGFAMKTEKHGDCVLRLLELKK